MPPYDPFVERMLLYAGPASAAVAGQQLARVGALRSPQARTSRPAARPRRWRRG